MPANDSNPNPPEDREPLTAPTTGQAAVALAGAAGTGSSGLSIQTRFRPLDVMLKMVFGACAFISVITTFGIIYVLFSESIPFFKAVSLREFFTGTKWTPQFDPAQFGVLPLICGTFLVAGGAALFTLPMGLLAAIYLSEYATPRARNTLKPVLEILAGVPTVVYGYFALLYITPVITVVVEKLTPLLQRVFPNITPEVGVFNALSASIAIAIMTLPLVCSLCEDALHVVPRSLREGAYALGATKMEVSTKVVVPAALAGIAASFILAISRAVGETMIVAMAAGSTPQLTLNPLKSIQTMTGYIAQIALGDVPHGTVSYQTIFAVGLTLFAITAMMNVLSIALVKKYRQKYD